MKALWATGDWAEIAKTLDGASEQLVDFVEVGEGARVLEVAAGNGNAAVWAARRGAKVTATDICPEMIAKGRERTEQAGLKVEWKEADFEELPFEDGIFDRVLSAFGVIFATRPNLVISEVFRVTKPGGVVALVNWTPDGWPAQVGAIMGKYLNGGSRGPRGLDWGVEQDLSQMLDPHAFEVRFRRGAVWTHSDSAESWWKHWDQNSPMMIAARNKLPATQYQCLSQELIESVKQASTGAGPLASWKSDYLMVTARKNPVAAA
ncbi:MAG: class I SAM-dependent methyltransferase [Actinomycetota bacterium]